MARKTRRELEIADHLWDCLTRIAEDCGTDRHAVVNQAVYELARRYNFLTPLAKDVPPEQGLRPTPKSEALQAHAKPQTPPQAAQKALYVVNGSGEMHKIDKDTFIIGRSRTCDLVIPSSKVSRQHSGVCRENGEYYIEDLNSANGVWKDGVKISKEKIRDGEEYMISEEVLRFVFR